MMAVPTALSDDAIATVLVASYLGLPPRSGTIPLGPAGWFNLASTLHQSGKRPAFLLGADAAALQSELGLSPEAADAIVRLTERAGNLGFDLERLTQRGIWVMTRGDEYYPRRLASKIGSNRPPVLFGAGPRDFLDGGGVAIVGSRDVDEAGGEFAGVLGAQAARSGLNVISGGARGVDRLAMQGAIDADGVAVGVLTDGLERWIKDPELRGHIHNHRLTLVTPFKPDAGFNAANAMARNKYVYALSDFAVVVASDRGKGGTWTGAMENLRPKNRWSDLFVRAGGGVPAGNAALIAEGGIPLRREDIDAGDLRASLEALRDLARPATPGPGAGDGQMPLFGGDPGQQGEPPAKGSRRRKPSGPAAS